jgi:O-acetyl-ADP-ribose deacetylase (regulator of RNase III)
LTARYVIHAASMALGGQTKEAGLRESTRNSLMRAQEKSLESIAFPAIGTGIAGFPMDRCAEVMLEEIHTHLNWGNHNPARRNRAFRCVRLRDFRASVFENGWLTRDRNA